MRRKIHMLIIRFSTAFLLILFSLSVADAGHWINTYGTPGYERVWEMQQTADNGFIVVGSTGFFNEFYLTNETALVLKLNSSGRIEWQKILKKFHNGVVAATAQSVQQTLDGGYIVAGVLFNPDSGSRLDAWVVKLDANGNVLWEKAYSIAMWDFHSYIRKTQDGGYIMAVSSMSYGYLVLNSILKLDGNGNIVWLKRIRDVDWLQINDVQQDADGNYIAVGFAYQDGADTVTGGPLVVKLDANGNILWQKVYTNDSGANWSAGFTSIKPTSDVGYIAVGIVTFLDEAKYLMVLKLNKNGEILWHKTFGGPYWGYGSDIQPTSDGGFIIAGSTGSYDEDDPSAWIAKLDASGLIEWQKKFGGSERDWALSIQQTSDDGYIVAGVTESIGEGSQDIFILKLDKNGLIPDCDLVSPSYVEFSPANIAESDFTASAVDKTITPEPVESDIEEGQILAQAWCWKKWEGRFEGLDWLDRAMICLEWPSGVGVGIPQRCAPGSPCIFCQYNLSKYVPADKIPDFLLKLYEDIIPILNGRIFQDETGDALHRMEKRFGNAPTGPFYSDRMKASILHELKRSKVIRPQLSGKLVEAINAIELDLIAPHKSSAKVEAGKYIAADFDGVAWVAMNNVEKSGTAMLKIKHGLPASAKGMQPAWPIASYEFDFTGALEKNGYLDISFYIGGINLAGRKSQTRILQWDGNRYKDITTHVDTARKTITGRTNQLSTYVIMNGRARFSSNLNCFKP